MNEPIQIYFIIKNAATLKLTNEKFVGEMKAVDRKLHILRL